MTLLVSKSCDINKQDEFGKTALSYAIEKDDIAIAKVLRILIIRSCFGTGVRLSERWKVRVFCPDDKPRVLARVQEVPSGRL